MVIQGLIQGGGGVDGVASHPAFTCLFMQDTMGTGVSLLASHPPLFSIVKYRQPPPMEYFYISTCYYQCMAHYSHVFGPKVG